MSASIRQVSWLPLDLPIELSPTGLRPNVLSAGRRWVGQ